MSSPQNPNHEPKKAQSPRESVAGGTDSLTNVTSRHQSTHTNSTAEDDNLASHNSIDQPKDVMIESRFLPRFGQISHPNFMVDAKLEDVALDPARPLSDTPTPVRRHMLELSSILGDDTFSQVHINHVDMQSTQLPSLPNWGLIASEELMSHLELLHVGGLIELPTDVFAQHHSHHHFDASLQASLSTSLPSPLTELQLIDLNDIRLVQQALPSLTRYGMQTATSDKQEAPVNELLNEAYADDWHIILHPEQFDNGEDSLATDVMACSVAVHLLGQCDTRKTINRGLSAEQMCHHARSYVLSQCGLRPELSLQYRQIRLFTGHIIFAMHHLGLDTSVTHDGEVFANLSSRSALFTHYPNVPSYYVTGWN